MTCRSEWTLPTTHPFHFDVIGEVNRRQQRTQMQEEAWMHAGLSQGSASIFAWGDDMMTHRESLPHVGNDTLAALIAAFVVQVVGHHVVRSKVEGREEGFVA